MPPVRLGIVTDIQHADKEDQYISYTQKVRHYSQALPKTKTAVSRLNTYELDATLHLGDIIDGNKDLESTRADLDAVLTTLAPLKSPVMHVLGNHCLDAGRAYLLGKFGVQKAHYSFDIAGWRVVVLDTVDISASRDEPQRTLALKYLEEHKGEANANDWNGGLGDAQKEWLRRELSSAEGNVVVCGHLPVICNNTEEHTIWEFDELHKTFVEFRVKAYFAGHFHAGDYVCKDGIHYVTFESILDSKHELGSYGVVELHERRIEIRGFGDMTSRVLEF